MSTRASDSKPHQAKAENIRVKGKVKQTEGREKRRTTIKGEINIFSARTTTLNMPDKMK